MRLMHGFRAVFLIGFVWVSLSGCSRGVFASTAEGKSQTKAAVKPTPTERQHKAALGQAVIDMKALLADDKIEGPQFATNLGVIYTNLGVAGVKSEEFHDVWTADELQPRQHEANVRTAGRLLHEWALFNGSDDQRAVKKQEFESFVLGHQDLKSTNFQTIEQVRESNGMKPLQASPAAAVQKPATPSVVKGGGLNGKSPAEEKPRVTAAQAEADKTALKAGKSKGKTKHAPKRRGKAKSAKKKPTKK